MKIERHSQTGRAAFSLVEIMVAVTLLAVITVGLLAMFYQTQKAFRLGASQVDILESGRATAQLLSLEMQEMYPSYADTVTNFVAKPRAARLMMPGVRTNLLQDISFLTRRGDEWIGITYRVDHNNRGAGTLYRAVLATNAWTNFITGRPMAVAQIASVSNVFAGITKPVGVITNDPNLRFDRIADGIVHLRVRAFDQRGRVYNEAPLDEYHFTNFVPAYLELELGVLDPKAVEQFRARSANPASARNYLTNQAHRVHLFNQRIPIRTRHAEVDLFSLK